MKIVERSYSAKVFQPKPHVHVSDDSQVVIITTSWSQPEHGQKVTEEISKYLEAARSDVEVTSPFEYLPILSKPANDLRIALLIANEVLHRTENRQEYSAAVEVAILMEHGQSISYARVGGPQILAHSAHYGLQPVSVEGRLNSEPLPTNLLGLESGCLIQAGTRLVGEGDQIVLLSTPLVAGSLFYPAPSLSLQDATQRIVQDFPHQPFWLGMISRD